MNAGDSHDRDHYLDVRIRLVHELERQIEEGVSGEDQADDPLDEGDEWQGYFMLESFDHHVLAPIAVLAALHSDPGVHALTPDVPEVGRWYEVIERKYRQMKRLERLYLPRPAGSMLYNKQPGKEPSPEFWLERQRETDDVFRRLLKSPGPSLPEYWTLPPDET